MYEVIKLFFGICIFRKAPQDIPYSLLLLQFAALVYVGIGLLLLLLSAGLLESLLHLLVEILMVAGFSWALLTISGMSERYIQTLTALLGTDAVISLLALPVMSSMITPQGSALAIPLLMVMMVWQLLVSAHIFRHALSRSFSFGLAVAFLYFFVSYRTMAMLFPQADIIS